MKKFSSHIKKDLLLYKLDLLTYTKKGLLINAKNPRQILTENSCGNFLRQIAIANSHGKFLRQILAANRHGKFLQQIPTANSRVILPLYLHT